jgi:hypothetical protein
MLIGYLLFNIDDKFDSIHERHDSSLTTNNRDP